MVPVWCIMGVCFDTSISHLTTGRRNGGERGKRGEGGERRKGRGEIRLFFLLLAFLFVVSTKTALPPTGGGETKMILSFSCLITL